MLMDMADVKIWRITVICEKQKVIDYNHKLALYPSACCERSEPLLEEFFSVTQITISGKTTELNWEKISSLVPYSGNRHWKSWNGQHQLRSELNYSEWHWSFKHGGTSKENGKQSIRPSTNTAPENAEEIKRTSVYSQITTIEVADNNNVKFGSIDNLKLQKNNAKANWKLLVLYMTDWFQQHVHTTGVILSPEVRESDSLYVNIYLFVYLSF